jgi:hypothetical protein
MNKASIILIGFFVMVVAGETAFAQKEKYHSIFIYNFSKYVKWPSDQNTGDFVIGVYGSSEIIEDLKVMAASKKVNGQNIRIEEFKSMEDLATCHILYVGASESNKISQIVGATKGSPVLIVTDEPGLAQKGSVINFVEVGGKIKFELNQQTAESRGLKVSSSLTTLAIMV